MTSEEKRAVLETLGWVLCAPGVVKTSTPKLNDMYIFVGPGEFGKQYLDFENFTPFSDTAQECIEDAYLRVFRRV
jgi:hypothetical protein